MTTVNLAVQLPDVAPKKSHATVTLPNNNIRAAIVYFESTDREMAGLWAETMADDCQ